MIRVEKEEGKETWRYTVTSATMGVQTAGMYATESECRKAAEELAITNAMMDLANSMPVGGWDDEGNQT